MTRNNFQVENIDVDDILDRASTLKEQGYRLVQIEATNVEGGQEITYSFDRDYELINLRVTLPQGEPIMSITGPYFAAFVYENEIKDLFGVNVKHLALDFNGNFFKTSVDQPWKPEADATAEESEE